MYINKQTIKDLIQLKQIKYNEDENIYVSKNGDYTIKQLDNKYKVTLPRLNNDGYMYPGVGLSRTKSMNRLVAETFIPIPEHLQHLYGTRELQVDHINDNKLDNRVENLQWLTQKENLKKRKPFTISMNRTNKYIFKKDDETLEFDSLKSAAKYFETTTPSILTSIRLIHKYKGYTLIRE